MSRTKASEGVSAEHLREALIKNAPRLAAFIQARLPLRLCRHVGVDDVLQEVWIAAFRNRHGFVADRPDAIDRWLTTITQTKLLNAIKAGLALRRGGKETFEACAARSESYLDLFARVANPQRTPSSEVALGEASTTIRIALAELPDARRQALILRYIERQTCGEIATSMNRTKASVNSLLFHGLRQLQEALGSASKFLSDG